MKKIIVFTAAVALLNLACCTSKKEEKKEDSKFIITSPLKMDTSFTKEYVSQIRSVRNIEIRA